MNQNCWNGAGRLTKDADFGETKKGTPMSKFRLAVNDRRNDDTLFVNVLCFGKMITSRRRVLFVSWQTRFLLGLILQQSLLEANHKYMEWVAPTHRKVTE